MPSPPLPRTLAGLSLRDLEYAITIAEEQSFGRAATICAVSQPAISQQIKKLEALLGLTLFERRGRRVIVTAEGQQVLERAKILLSDARGLFEIASNLTDPLKGDIRLGVIPTLGPYFMPHILRPLRHEFPELRLRPYEDTTDNLLAQLRAHKIDIALIAAPATRSDISSTTVFFEPFVLACPVGHALAKPAPLPEDQLATLDLLMLSREHCLRDQTIALCNIPPNQGTRVASSLEMLRQMIAVGEGCALLPALAATNLDTLSSNSAHNTALNTVQNLVAIRPIAAPAATAFGRQVTMIWRSSDPRQEPFQLLARFLQSRMETPQMRGLLLGAHRSS